MYKYLVIGLESSGTRLLSKILAFNLQIIDSPDDWDAFDEISNNMYSVTHRSMPHGAKGHGRFIPSLDYINSFDCVLIISRDINCVINSKLNSHDNDINSVRKDNKESIKILKNAINSHKNLHIFSYETAENFQDSYVEYFLNKIGITMSDHVKFNNENKKYFKGKNDY